MIISPARFEDEYKAIPKRTINEWEDLTNNVVLPPELWNLFCDTLDSLGYGATINKIKAEVDGNSK